MDDSTRPQIEPTGRTPWASAHPRVLPGRLDIRDRRPVGDIVRLVEQEIPFVVERLLAEDAQNDGPRADVLARIAREVGSLAVAIRRHGRIARPFDVVQFRALGADCATAGVKHEHMVAALDATGEAILDAMVARAHDLDEIWSPARIDQAVIALCACMKTLTRVAYDELVKGTRVSRRTSGRSRSPLRRRAGAHQAQPPGVASRSDGRGRHLARAVRPCGRASRKVNTFHVCTACV
jgi:hypothetical protein